MIRPTLGVWALAAVASTTWAQSDSLTVVVEPGIITSSGALVPFRVLNAQGAPFRVNAVEIALEIGGSPVAADLVSFRGDAPTDVLWLVDRAAFEGIDVAPWAAELGGVAMQAGMRVAFVGDHFAGSSGDTLEIGEIRDRLQKPKSTRLWDGILRGVGALSQSGSAERRVLVVITEGVEEKESRHPVVTCIDAADSARVAIYAVSPRPTGTTDDAGIARLRLLARRTGGAFDGGGTPSAVSRMRDVVLNAQGLRVRPSPAPSTITVRAGLAAARAGQGALAARRVVVVEAPPNPALPGIIGGTVVLIAVVAAWTLRHRPVGRLVAVRGAQTPPILVTRSGVTLGGAQGNALVLDHPKISRNHAVIRVRKGKVTLVDLRSSNGTRLNGRKIESAPLEHGDRIVLADAVELRFERRFRFGGNG